MKTNEVKPKTTDEIYAELQEVRKEQKATTHALKLVIQALQELMEIVPEEELTEKEIDMSTFKQLDSYLGYN